MLALEPLEGLVVLDEIRRRPDLFPSLRVLADRADSPCRILILGSASPKLLRQSSESLAGRIAHHELFGFDSTEVGTTASSTLWLRGGFPLSFLAESETSSFEWRRDFVWTYVERDLPNLGVNVAPATMRRFWTMLAHYHAQVWNGTKLARSFGVGETSRRHPDRSGTPLTYQPRKLPDYWMSSKYYSDDIQWLHSSALDKWARQRSLEPSSTRTRDQSVGLISKILEPLCNSRKGSTPCVTQFQSR